jgi:hypothetical protein
VDTDSHLLRVNLRTPDISDSIDAQAILDGIHQHFPGESGKFSHSLGAGGLSAPVLSSCRYWVNRAAVLGEQCGQIFKRTLRELAISIG